jgi:hypothetical protein
MKKITTLCLLLNVFFANAQPYFVDTLNSTTYPLMNAVFEQPNNQGYAISTFENYDFNLIYTDLYGHRTSQKSWAIFDSLQVGQFTRNITKMPNGNYAVAILLKNPTTPYRYTLGKKIYL